MDCPNCGFQLTPSNMSRAHRLPRDWTLPAEWLEWTRRERYYCDAYAEAEKFRDYWHAKAGKDASKLDWFATWRNWIRSAPASKVQPKPAAHAPIERDSAPKLSAEQREANRARLAGMLSGALK